MDEYDFTRRRMQVWEMAACAALAGGKTYTGAIQSADHIQAAWEQRFPVEERPKD